MEAGYYYVKAQILALATAYHEGDEATRSCLRRKADFFPISRERSSTPGLKSMIVRLRGEIFLVEDTVGGETAVFSLLLPLI